MTAKIRLLLIDDGDTYAQLIREQMPECELIRPPGADTDCVGDGPEAISFLEKYKGPIDLVLLDMFFDIPEDKLFPLDEGASLRRTRRFQGVAILREIHARFPALPVVLLTSLEDLSLVDAAKDLVSQSMTYVLDGQDVDALRVRIAAATKRSRVEDGSRVLWGENSVMKAIQRRLTVLARGAMPVILEGETGTGKSWLAEQYVHVNSGRPGPFIVLDLSTIPENLLSAHLFGAVKGAYTGAVESRKGVFEMANEGTLFIDEIQNAPLEVQKQLLLVLQDKKVRPLGASREILVDVKVVAASNRPLDEAVAQGTFRPDLYMRLSPATCVQIPPLRMRLEDLYYLANRFARRALQNSDIASLVKEVATSIGISTITDIRLVIGRNDHTDVSGSLQLVIPKPVWRMMESHSWPGNIRELEMIIYNLITFTLVDAIDTVQRGIPITNTRLQVDAGLVGNLLLGARALERKPENGQGSGSIDDNRIPVTINSAGTLNDVANDVERQYFLTLFHSCNRDFAQMAHRLLGDSSKARAVRLRFNQLGLRVRDIKY
ncbi:MAG: sigma-54-dependent Fis family transcriptional regulator [Deltaproteobacteria bacterium]|nr:sigma-54-dependent Fis family transcriptional regulator [Deltaproteobacteria bacterium]